MVSKKFYIEDLKGEFGVTHDGKIVGNNVYQPVHISKPQLFEQHEDLIFLFFYYRISTSL